MATIAKNTVFTNVGETSDGGVWWEGLDPPPAGVTLTDWHGKTWKQGDISCSLLVYLTVKMFTAPSSGNPADGSRGRAGSSTVLIRKLMPPLCTQEVQQPAPTPTPASAHQRLSVPSLTQSGRVRRAFPLTPSFLVAGGPKVGTTLIMKSLFLYSEADVT